MDYKYYFTQKAADDVEEILDYVSVELGSLAAARNLYSDIFKNIEELKSFPDMGMPVDNEYLSDKSVRRLLVENYTVFYKVFNSERKIYVLRVVYSKRNLNEILSSI